MPTKEEIKKEIICRELEARNKLYADNFYEYFKHYREKEKKIVIDENRHIKLICDKLEDVYYGRIKRLMINVPPRSFKTEIVSIAFIAWCLWKQDSLKFMNISYSSWIAQGNSMACRAMYKSDTYRAIFPRSAPISDDLDTKQHRTNKNWWQYYASGATWTITGKWCDIMVIDDPLKPDDAMSDVVRVWVNNNFHNTLKSRLNNKMEWAIVIIMQRLHDDDLCGHLLELEGQWWEKREKVVIRAIAEEDDEYRKQGESFFEKRFPLAMLYELKKASPQTFSSQMQQEPTNKETQEFHEERFRYHWTELTPTPSWLRIFTTVDPAFKQGQHNDNSCITTWWFIDSKLYILEQTAWKFTADILQEKIIYHIQKRQPEKVWIEAFQAQSMIATYLKQELQRRWLFANIEDITQSGDKLSKLRKLVPLYRDGLIYHNLQLADYELELKRFPRGKNDDRIDSVQMLYSLYELQQNNWARREIQMAWDEYGNPMIV